MSVSHPEIAQGWHLSKNFPLRPSNFLETSHCKVWWQCSLNPNHEWLQTICRRISRGCPQCKLEQNSLARLCPEIAAKWHPILNRELKPDQVTCGSGRKVWWLCKKTGLHEWERTIGHMTSQRRGCPVCKKVQTDNSLQALFPAIAAEWHPSKNRQLFPSWDTNYRRLATARIQKNRRLKPSDVAAFSNEDAWWQCKVSLAHVWQDRISHRTSNRSGCPFCSGVRITVDNNFAFKNPTVVKQWHPTRNLPLTPDGVGSGSEKVVWWRCFRSAEHVWQAKICKIVSSHAAGHSGCPFCAGRRVGRDNNLAFTHPRVAELWHNESNFPLLPSQFTAGSGVGVWWQCPIVKNHLWKAKIHHLVESQKYKSRGCPFCSGVRVKKEESLLAKYPELAKIWDKSQNLPLLAKNVSFVSNKIVHWRCIKRNEHIWEASIRSMVSSCKTGRKLCRFC